MAQHQPIRKTTPPSGPDIPDKLYFRIGEVAKLCDVPAYVLRFWESEFPQLKPHKGGTGQRLYRRRDVEMAMRIKSLLYNEGYTIPGARQVFKGELKQREPQLALAIEGTPSDRNPRQLQKLQKDLRDLLTMLSKSPVRAAVHPIRAPRPSTTRRTAEKLFDLPSFREIIRAEMSLEDELGQKSRRRDRPRTPKTRTSYFGAEVRKGVPIQCQYCSGQTFRRSTLRSEDLTEIFLMRYPVRCLRCSQRQMVSFTIASLSLSSGVKPNRRPRTVDASSHWKEPSGDSGIHKPSSSTSTHE